MPDVIVMPVNDDYNPQYDEDAKHDAEYAPNRFCEIPARNHVWLSFEQARRDYPENFRA